MAIYEKDATTNLKLVETHMYSSNQLGIFTCNIDMVSPPTGEITIFERGKKLFELSNHLGNVLVTASDRKIQVSAGGVNVDYYTADVVSATDNYVFGMMMPERNFQGDKYRYGFNGKEKEKGISVGHLDFGARIYDARIGKWLSLDPMQEKYPHESHYAFVSDNPILYADEDGRDKIITITLIGYNGTRATIQVVDKSYFQYESENVYGGGKKYYKYNATQSITVDLQKMSFTGTSPVRDLQSGKRISGWEYSKASDVLPAVMDAFSSLIRTPKTGDNSNKEMYGWRIYGTGIDMEWQKGLPKAASGEGGIDITKLVKIAGTMAFNNSSLSGLYSDVITKWMRYTGKDMKQVFMALNIIVYEVDGATKVYKNMKEFMKLVGLLSDKPKEEPKTASAPTAQDNSTPRIEPGRTIVPDRSFRTGNPVYCKGCDQVVQWNKKGGYWQMPSGAPKDTMEGKDHNKH